MLKYQYEHWEGIFTLWKTLLVTLVMWTVKKVMTSAGSGCDFAWVSPICFHLISGMATTLATTWCGLGTITRWCWRSTRRRLQCRRSWCTRSTGLTAATMTLPWWGCRGPRNSVQGSAPTSCLPACPCGGSGHRKLLPTASSLDGATQVKPFLCTNLLIWACLKKPSNNYNKEMLKMKAFYSFLT